MAAVSPGWHDLFSLRVRLVVIFAVASLPLLTASSILIAARPPGPSASDAATSAGLLALAYAVGLAVVSAASYAFVVKPLRALNASVSVRGVICQERPQRSLHQPQSLSCPPLPTIAFQ